MRYGGREVIMGSGRWRRELRVRIDVLKMAVQDLRVIGQDGFHTVCNRGKISRRP